VDIKIIDEIIDQVYKNLDGRFANAGNSAHVLLDLIKKAGDGNYLEIGVLHGGSLCAVALYKKKLGHEGKCIGVDPFNGFYYDKTGKLTDKSGIPVIEDTVLNNIKKFDLNNIELIKASSPEFSTNNVFAVTYIDGDHSSEGVWKDWNKVKDITTDFVIFHDFGVIKGVTKAVELAISDSEWSLFSTTNLTAVLQKNFTKENE